MSGERVLVTGGSGFIGAHCIVRLLDEGYRVRTTVRSLAREKDVRAMVSAGRAQAARGAGTADGGAGTADGGAGTADPGAGTADGGDALDFAVADLGTDDGWAEAVAGCAYVLHVASPFPPGEPEHEDDLIVPARDGALRVLRAARDAGVKRVVLTSSFGAVGYGHPQTDEPFTEETWTDVEGPGVSAYVKSKTSRSAPPGSSPRGRAAARNWSWSTRSASSVPCSGPTTPPRSRSSGDCSTEGCRECRGCTSRWWTCAMSLTCTCWP